MSNKTAPDRWKLAEIQGAWYSLLLKVDVLTATSGELKPAQELLSTGLELLETAIADLYRKGTEE